MCVCVCARARVCVCVSEIRSYLLLIGVASVQYVLSAVLSLG